MSNVTACLLEHFGRKSPIEPYREDMAGDAKELIASGMDSDAAWRQVTEAKLSELRAERARITGMVSEAYAKTPAGKKALEQAKVQPDETPKSEKPRVFKSRKNAIAERDRLGNEHKLQKIKGGYILRRKTDKEMAAEARAGRRFASGAVSGLRRSLLATIAAGGGLNISERPDTIGEGNRNVGGRMVFTRAGKTINQWAETLAQSGFIPPSEAESDDGVRWLQEAIGEEFAGRREHFAMDDEARMEEAARASQGEEPAPDDDQFGPLSDFDLEELSADGYAAASPEVQALTEQVLSAADEAGIDIEALREDAARLTEGLSDDEYHAQLQASARAAIAQTRTDAARRDAGADQASKRDRGASADTQGDEGTASEGLTFDEAQDAQSERFEVGRSLTSAQRREVLATLVDVYKAKGAPREQKGIGRDGNERYGYVHSPDLFERSDITGAMVRYYVKLPDKRIAHPSELFPDFTQAQIDAALIEQANAEKHDAANQHDAEAAADKFAEPTKHAAAVSFEKRNPAFNMRDWRTGAERHLVFFEKDGQFYAVVSDDAGRMERIERAGWKRAGDDLLTTQTETDLREKTEREAAAKAAEAKQKADEQRRLEREALDRETRDRARQDASAENFVLGQDANDALAGQGSIFDAPGMGDADNGALYSRAQGAGGNTPAEVRRARAAHARIVANNGVASADDLRDMLRVPGYSQWAESALVGNVDSAAAVRRELADSFPGTNWQRPILNAQGVITFYGLGDNREQALATLTAIADRHGAPIAVRGHAQSYAQDLRDAGFIGYSGMQEVAGRPRDAMIQWIRPAGGIGENTPLFSIARTGDEANALKALSENDELFALPKSSATTVEAIAADIDPQIKVTPHPAEGLDRYTLTMPDGKTAELFVRTPGEFGPHSYGTAREGEPAETVRPGEDQYNMRGLDDVWINVSRLEPGGGGARIYAIAGDFAHNTGRVFIGDPAGVSDTAMRRRSEAMLSSALRWGTTEHLAPHPMQVRGDKSIGVPPLRWVEGDDLGNIRNLIDVNLKALDNAFPSAKQIEFDVATGQFRNAVNGRPIDRLALRERVRAMRSSGASGASMGEAGGNTIARGAVWRALLREAGGTGETGGRRDGLLARLARLGSDAPQAVGKLFAKGEGESTAQDLRSALESEFGADTISALERSGLLTIAERPAANMPQDAAGVTENGRIGLFADNTAPGSTAVAYHEALHATLRASIGDAAYDALMARMPTLASGNKAFFAEANKRIPANTPASVRAEEQASYAVEAYQKNREAMPAGVRKFVQDLIAAFKAGLAKALQAAGVGLKLRVTLLSDAAVLHKLARDGLRTMAREAGQDAQRSSAPAFSVAPTTDSAAFRKWFGDSKVVDAQGRPLVVYHGTAQDMIGGAFSADLARSEGGGFYFSHSPLMKNPATNANEYAANRSGDSPQVMPVYLSMQNPLVTGFVEPMPSGDAAISAWLDRMSRFNRSIDMTKERYYRNAIRQARAGGHDGVIIRNVEDVPNDAGRRFTDEADVYIAFRPEQIKSATGNTGAFDAANPDIRYSRAAPQSPAGPAPTGLAAAAQRLRNAGGGTRIIGQTARQYTPEQIEAMRNVGFQVDTPTIEERIKSLWKDAGKKLAQGLVDQFAPVKAISAEAYGLLRLAKGASGAFETLLKGGKLKLSDGVYDFDDTDKGGVIESLLMPLQGEHHDFLRWVAANRAERLASEGKENLFSDDDIDNLKSLSDGTTDFDYTIQHGARAGQTTRDRTLIYEDSLKTFNGFNKNVLDMAEQSGLIDAESRKVWEHEFYVPFYRVADEDDGGVKGMNVRGGAVRQEAFKRLKGGRNALNNDLLDNTLMNWAHLLDASAKNRAAVETLNAAESVGAAISSTESAIRDMSAAMQKKNGVVWVMEGGEKHFYLIEDPHLVTALTALDYAGMKGPVMDAMGTFKRVLTIGVTASPFFKVRNLIRDSIQAIGTGDIGYNAAANIAQGWKLTSPKSDAYFRLLAGGGTIHFGTMTEGNEGKRIQALVESGVDRSTILSDENSVKAFYRRFIEPGITAYNELGNRGEAINRASLYAQLRAKGVNHAEASLQARDLMDFSMQGSFTTVRFLTQVVPFFNARIQGLYKLGRSTTEDPARMGIVLGATAAASLALLLAYSDDDDWKKREDWDRNNFWWFKFGGTAFRIPKPFEIGAIASLAERGFELAFSKEMTSKRFGQNVLELLGNNLSMNPVPQLVKPMLDVYANLDSFTGRPVESMGMERLRPEYRFTGRSSMLARGASTAANAVTNKLGFNSPSPVQIDHMLRGYFGWLGAFIIGASEIVVRPATGQVSQPMPDLFRAATGNMVSDLRDAPSRYVSQMYDQARELEEAYGTWRALLKSGKTEEAAEFRADNRDELNRYRFVERVKSDVSKINQRIRAIEQSDLGAMEKRLRIREANVMKDRLARRLEVH